MTDHIRKEIKKRKEWNTATRSVKIEKERSRLEAKYKEQKGKVNKLIRKVIEEHELKTTKEIREKTNKQKQNYGKI